MSDNNCGHFFIFFPYHLTDLLKARSNLAGTVDNMQLSNVTFSCLNPIDQLRAQNKTINHARQIIYQVIAEFVIIIILLLSSLQETHHACHMMIHI